MVPFNKVTISRVLSDTPATKLIVAVNILVFVALAAVTGVKALVAPGASTLIDWGANIGALTAGGQFWRLLTSNYLHVGFLHLALNLYFVWTAGSPVEKDYGTARYCIIFVASGIVGSLATIVWDPAAVSAGASASIYGLVGAMMSQLWGHRAHYPPGQARMQIIVIVLFVAYSLIYAGLNPLVDNAAHCGGLVAGLIAGALLLPETPEKKSWRRRDWAAVGGLVVALVVAVPWVSMLADKDSRTVAYRLGKQGEALMTQGKYQQALAKFEAVLAVNKGSASAHGGKALAFIGLKKYAAAVNEATIAIALKRDDASAYLARAVAHHFLGNALKSIADSTEAIKINPRSAAGYNSRAWSLVPLGKYAEALADVNKSLALEPKKAAAYDTRGVIYARMGESEKALADFARGLSIDPKEGACYFHRAELLAKLGRTEEAALDRKRWRESDYEPEPWEKEEAGESEVTLSRPG